MSSASRSLNYELAYISISKQGIESLRYRHAVIGNVPLGQLLHMDGPRREVLQRGGGISYFEHGTEPFTLTGDHIVDALPAIVYADFTRLAKYYDFISVGSTRIADRPCEVLRVVGATVPATATSSGWTRTPSCRCGWICSIATAKRWSNIG